MASGGRWRAWPANLTNVIALHARYADVVIVGQADPEEDEPKVTRERQDELILATGRPVLVIPYIGAYPMIGERVLVA